MSVVEFYENDKSCLFSSAEKEKEQFSPVFCSPSVTWKRPIYLKNKADLDMANGSEMCPKMSGKHKPRRYQWTIVEEMHLIDIPYVRLQKQTAGDHLLFRFPTHHRSSRCI